MLLIECEEAEQLQRELDEIREQFDVMSESYERLKGKLDVKDARLNQKDEEIAGLHAEIDKLHEETGRLRRAGEAGSAIEAAERIGAIYKEAEAAVEEYLTGICQAETKKQFSVEPGKISSIRRAAATLREEQKIPKQAEPEVIYLEIPPDGNYG